MRSCNEGMVVHDQQKRHMFATTASLKKKKAPAVLIANTQEVTVGRADCLSLNGSNSDSNTADSKSVSSFFQQAPQKFITKMEAVNFLAAQLPLVF